MDEYKYFLFSVLILFVGTIVLINRHSSTKPVEEKLTSAFNPKVPEAHLNTKPKNKLELYMEAMKDSVQHANLRLKDPYITGRDTGKAVQHPLPPAGRSVFNPAVGNVDANEAKVNDRLKKLLKELNKPVETNLPASKIAAPVELPAGNPDIERMEKLLQNINTSAGPDKDLQKIDTLVNKLMQLQSGQAPTATHNETKSPLAKKVLPVTNYPVAVTETNNLPEMQTTVGFYGLNGADQQHYA